MPRRATDVSKSVKTNTGVSRVTLGKAPTILEQGELKHADCKELDCQAFRDMPVNKCMAALALEHSANKTGHLDWYAGSERTGKPLQPVSHAYLDTVVLATVLPDYAVEIGQNGNARVKKGTMNTCESPRILAHCM